MKAPISKAMILAAGAGKRMRPITLDMPKPLIAVGKHSLIEHQILRLVGSGIKQIVINVSYLGEMIKDELGDGNRYGVELIYSEEKQVLDTGGGIFHALPTLGEDPFLLVNSDVWVDGLLFRSLTKKILQEGMLAYLVLVPNPEHHPGGDFALDSLGLVRQKLAAAPAYTYSGISIINPKLLSAFPRCREVFPLIEALSWAMENSSIAGELYQGGWLDIGTEERLLYLRQRFNSSGTSDEN